MSGSYSGVRREILFYFLFLLSRNTQIYNALILIANLVGARLNYLILVSSYAQISAVFLDYFSIFRNIGLLQDFMLKILEA